MDDVNGTDGGAPRHRRRLGRAGPSVAALALLAGLALLATACSSGSVDPGVASAGSGTDPGHTSSNGSTKAGPLAFSRCMRSHGVPSFPDPNAKGELQIQANQGSGLDPRSSQFRSAMQACKSLAPSPTPAQQHQALETGLKFAQCMRSHGISDFPDPSSQGGIEIHGSVSGSDLNPSSPRFQSAQNACQHYLSGLRGGGIRTTIHGGGGSPSSGKSFVGGAP